MAANRELDTAAAWLAAPSAEYALTHFKLATNSPLGLDAALRALA